MPHLTLRVLVSVLGLVIRSIITSEDGALSLVSFARALFSRWRKSTYNITYMIDRLPFLNPSVTAIILVITPICSGLTRNWEQLFAVRFLLGIGMGAKGPFFRPFEGTFDHGTQSIFNSKVLLFRFSLLRMHPPSFVEHSLCPVRSLHFDFPSCNLLNIIFNTP